MKLLQIFFLALALASCGSSSSSIPRRAKAVELGMARQEVIAIMGKNYQPEGQASLPDRNTELISYLDNENKSPVAIYFFRFKNGKLVEWYKEHLHIPPDPKSTIPKKVRKIEPGMSREQVTGIMGEDYETDDRKSRRNNSTVTITYVIEETLSLNAHYIFRFVDNRLVEWHRELKHLSGMPVYPK